MFYGWIMSLMKLWPDAAMWIFVYKEATVKRARMLYKKSPQQGWGL